MLSIRPFAREFRSALIECLRTFSLEPLRFHLAQTAFEAGRYRNALSHFRGRYRNPKMQARSLQMQDWIAFHLGDFSSGWPRYPKSDFDEPIRSANLAIPVEICSDNEIHVVDPRSPSELTTKLGLRWIKSEIELRQRNPAGSVVVWFNFKDSLGGEILVSRLINLLKSRYELPLVLACNPRLKTLLQASFPDCQVIGNKDDLSDLALQCSHYVLARDLLKILIQHEADFAAISSETLRVPHFVNQRLDESVGSVRSRPNIAISWKTTNRAQGRRRNLKLERFAKTLARKDAIWHVAQHGEITDDIRLLRHFAPNAMILENTIDPKGDMLTLAASLLKMDAVLTIDNTLLHLAGGLGVPTLAMIAIPAYWAWPSHGKSSRWYDSVQIIRQSRPGVWTDVLDAIDRALGKLS